MIVKLHIPDEQSIQVGDKISFNYEDKNFIGLVKDFSSTKVLLDNDMYFDCDKIKYIYFIAQSSEKDQGCGRAQYKNYRGEH